MKESLEKLNLGELRDICRKLELPVTGLKHEIVQRIFDFFTCIDVPVSDVATLLPNSSRVSVFRSFIGRISKSQFKSTPIDNESQDSLVSTFLCGNLMWIGDRFKYWSQQFGRFVRRLPTIFNIITGMVSLIQVFLFITQPHNQRIEVVLPRNSLPWC